MPKKPSTKTVAKIRKEPGKSNAYKYGAKEIYANSDGTYPLTKDGKPSLKRSESAKKLAHNSPNAASIKNKAQAMINKIKGSKRKK